MSSNMGRNKTEGKDQRPNASGEKRQASLQKKLEENRALDQSVKERRNSRILRCALLLAADPCRCFGEKKQTSYKM